MSVVRLAAVPTPERRRKTTLLSIGTRLRDVDLDLRTRVQTLGNREAYIELRNVADLLEKEIGRIEQLSEEFREESERAENNGGTP